MNIFQHYSVLQQPYDLSASNIVKKQPAWRVHFKYLFWKLLLQIKQTEWWAFIPRVQQRSSLILLDMGECIVYVLYPTVPHIFLTVYLCMHVFFCFSTSFFSSHFFVFMPLYFKIEILCPWPSILYVFVVPLAPNWLTLFALTKKNDVIN